MPNPNVPNTQGIYTAISTLMSGAKLSDGVTATYSNVIMGGVPDYTDLLPCCVIIPRSGSSQRRAFGGKIIEHIEFEIRSVVSNKVGATAETSIIAIRDSIIPLFQQHATLNGTANVYNLALKPGSEQYSWMFVEGNWYRIHQVTVVVAQEYTISTGIIS